MVSRLLRPVLHWTQETLRVAAPALAASARGTLGAALGSVLGGRDVPPPPPCAQQRRHRWASPTAFGTEQKAMAFLNEGAQREGLVKRWNNSKYYVKPYVARKQRYDRWERRRSVAKINTILDRVKYHKALAKQATSNAALAPIFEGKGSPAAGAGAGVAEQGKKA